MVKCKVCQSKHSDKINELFLKGHSLTDVFNWCKENGFKVSKQTLKNHLENHLEISQQVKEQLNTNSEVMTENVIYFEKYCKAIGLHPEMFTDLENNLENIIYGSQKALSLLFFKNTAIADYQLNKCLSNETMYPNDTIKGLRMVFEMYSKILGIETMIDENTAIKRLESLGYKISRTIDVDIND